MAAAQAGGLYRYNADFLQPKVPFSEVLAGLANSTTGQVLLPAVHCSWH